MKRHTVANAKRRLNQFHASRVLVASVAFGQRTSIPWIKGPHGSFEGPAYRAGYGRVSLP